VKADVDRATTQRVLSDIDDAVRPVLMARTAAAVERVLQSAAPAHGGGTDVDIAFLTQEIARWVGVRLVQTYCSQHCPGSTLACPGDIGRADATPGMTTADEWCEDLARHMKYQQLAYAPWVVSPHLLGATA
jgi:hypothetical protein